MLNIEQFKKNIVTPALSLLQLYSDDALELLVFTCAVESNGGMYVHQVGGPALGIYQMEPNTHTDIWINHIHHSPTLVNLLSLNFNCGAIPSPDRLIYDLRYATAMARIHYYRVTEALPDGNDSDGVWAYYKKYFNTPLGKAKKTSSLKKYEAFLKNK